MVKMAEQSGISLSPFLASVEFHALRGKVFFWDVDTPSVKERIIIVEGTPVVFTAHSPSSRSNTWEIDGDPRFWEKVRQLSFAFERGEWGKVREFYARYGLVRPLALSTTGGLDFPTITYRGLIWFRYLTNIAEWAKNGRFAPLREFFAEKGHEFFRALSYGVQPEKAFRFPMAPRVLSYGLSRVKPLESSQPQEEMDNRFWEAINPTLALFNTIIPVIQKSIRPPQLGRQRLPKVSTLRDHELIGYAWNLLAEVVGAKLGTIEFVPVYQQQTKSIPPVVWYFRAYCALDAAFLQWYFQEVAPLMARTCEAPGCNAPVLDPRAKYCSVRCYWRAKKRRYLERKARNSWVRKED